MREITPTLTPELEDHTKSVGVIRADPYFVRRYRDLVQHIARLAYLNKDHLLFYRGQGIHYRNKAGGATFYPSIYRGEQLDRRTMHGRFHLLDRASRRLRELFVEKHIDGYPEVARKRMIQWSVLQHYEVCTTPLLDFTHSIRVACSFAQAAADGSKAYVYVFGLPYITNRISANSEHDLVLVRLLSICPPTALRPYFQEGYLAGTTDVTIDYEDKSELDFNRRLIAQFEIPSGSAFWGPDLSRVTDEELFPPNDSIKELCASIDHGVSVGPEPEALGRFLAAWTALEQLVVTDAQRSQERVLTFGQALNVFRRRRRLSGAHLRELDGLRKLRNEVVHGIEPSSDEVLQQASVQVDELRNELREKLSR